VVVSTPANTHQEEQSRMQRIKITGLALMAVLALSVIASTTASAAEPEFAPAANKFTSVVGGAAKFEQKEGLAAVSCTKSTGKGEITAAKAGTFTELFEECTAPLSGKCTGLTATTKGDITVSGTFNLRYITKKTNVGIAFKINEVHFECEKLVTLVSVKGCAVGKVQPVNTKGKTTEAILKQSKGIQEFVSVLNEANSAQEGCKLESEFNGGSFKQAGQENTDKITTEKEGEIKA
jgi:hypothetical protein